MTDGLIGVRVLRTRKLAEEIAAIELTREDGEPLPSFTAGSHIDVHLGSGLIRQYSLWNDPSGADRYCLGVLREEPGRGGSHAVHKLQSGSRLSISPPRNRFELAPDAGDSLLLAGGIGITPILCMVQVLHARGAEFELHYCARSPGRMAFRDLLMHSDFAERVHLHFDDGPDEQKLDIPSIARAHRPGRHLYVCGPAGFMDAVLEAAASTWPSDTMHKEHFTLDAEPSDGEDRAFRVRVASTGEELEVPADRSVVETLAGIGIEIPTSCEQGICGTCITGVLEGTPDHRDYVLTEEEHAANDQMTVCCSRALSDLIVLDL